MICVMAWRELQQPRDLTWRKLLVLKYRKILIPRHTLCCLRYVFAALKGKAPSLRLYGQVSCQPAHCYATSARSGDLLRNREMRVMRISEDPINPLGERVGAQEAVGFDHFVRSILNCRGNFGLIR
jgi:hypothetical protein